MFWFIARYSFHVQAYGLTHSRLSDYPIRVLVQLFIDFFLLFSFANYCWKSCLYKNLFSFFYFLLMNIGLLQTCYLNKVIFFFEFGCLGKHNLRWKTFRKIILHWY